MSHFLSFDSFLFCDRGANQTDAIDPDILSC